MVPLPAAAVRFSGYTIVDGSELRCCLAGRGRAGRLETGGERLGEYSCRIRPLLCSARVGCPDPLGTGLSLALGFLSVFLATRLQKVDDFSV